MSGRSKECFLKPVQCLPACVAYNHRFQEGDVDMSRCLLLLQLSETGATVRRVLSVLEDDALERRRYTSPPPPKVR